MILYKNGIDIAFLDEDPADGMMQGDIRPGTDGQIAVRQRRGIRLPWIGYDDPYLGIGRLMRFYSSP